MVRGSLRVMRVDGREGWSDRWPNMGLTILGANAEAGLGWLAAVVIGRQQYYSAAAPIPSRSKLVSDDIAAVRPTTHCNSFISAIALLPLLTNQHGLSRVQCRPRARAKQRLLPKLRPARIPSPNTCPGHHHDLPHRYSTIATTTTTHASAAP